MTFEKPPSITSLGNSAAIDQEPAAAVSTNPEFGQFVSGSGNEKGAGIPSLCGDCGNEFDEKSSSAVNDDVEASWRHR